MVKLAILDETLGEQVRHSNIETDGLRLVYVGQSLQQLRNRATADRPEVMVVDLSLLGEQPVEELEKLLKLSDPELVIVLYHFAKRDLVDRLSTGKSRAIKAPITVGGLRLHILSLIVKDILKQKQASKLAS